MVLLVRSKTGSEKKLTIQVNYLGALIIVNLLPLARIISTFAPLQEWDSGSIFLISSEGSAPPPRGMSGTLHYRAIPARSPPRRAVVRVAALGRKRSLQNMGRTRMKMLDGAWPDQPLPCIRYLSNGVSKSNNTPAPSELPTRNQYKGMPEPASRLSSVPAR